MDETSEDDVVGEEMLRHFEKHRQKRRDSVSAGCFDPEKDTDEEPFEVFPKTEEQWATLKKSVENILIFRSLDESQMNCVIEAMHPREVSSGEVIIQQGDEGDFFYVIESGLFEAYVAENGEEPVLKMTYENSGSFGELALMYHIPRSATVKAVTDGILWALKGRTFQRLVVKSAYEKRQRYEALIKSVSVLQALDSYEVMKVCDALIPVTFQAGSVILQQGDEADGMYFIEEGEVQVTQVNDHLMGQVMNLGRLFKGAYFGEVALVTKGYRTATIEAVTDVKLAFLDVAAFERLLGPCMDYIKKNMETYRKE